MQGFLFPFISTASSSSFFKFFFSFIFSSSAASCVLLSLTADALDCKTQNIDVCHGKGSLSRTEKEEEIDIDLPLYANQAEKRKRAISHPFLSLFLAFERH